MERRCGRCGGTFDGTGLPPEALCQDCQDVTGQHYTNVWSNAHIVHGPHGTKTIPDAIEAERIRQINHYTHTYPRSAQEIADMMGTSKRQIERYRKKLDSPAPKNRIVSRGLDKRRAEGKPIGGAAQAVRGSNRPIPKEARRWLYGLMERGVSQTTIQNTLHIGHKTLKQIREEGERGEI